MTSTVRHIGWNKEPIPCWDCSQPSCSQMGDGHWYCFRCLMNMDVDLDEVEIDESLEHCPQQLELQSEAYPN